MGRTYTLALNLWLMIALGLIGPQLDAVAQFSLSWSEHGGGSAAGSVEVSQSAAVLHEGDSFLVSLQSDRTVRQGVSFHIVLQPGFDLTSTFVPDAFEASLLDAAGNSLVPPWKPGATSFFNIQENGTAHLSPRATYIGDRVSLDLTEISIPPGAKLYFDLIGGDRDTGSGVTIFDIITDGGCTDVANRCEFVAVLDSATQGQQCVPTLRPKLVAEIGDCPAPFVLSARTGILGGSPKDPGAAGSPGAVVLTPYGAGVSTADCTGDEAIAGVGRDEDEELVIEFDEPVIADEITLRIKQIDFVRDKPNLFISDPSSPGYEYIILASRLQWATTPAGFQEAILLVSRLSELPENLTIDRLKIRETTGFITVDLVRGVKADCP